MTVALPTTRECRDWITAIREHQRGDAEQGQEALSRLGITPVTGGGNNRLYRCARAGRACCIKLYRTDGRQRDEREWCALTFLATHLPGFGPRPLWYDPHGSPPMAAMEWLSGEPLLGLTLAQGHLAALAGQLGQIYAFTPATGDFRYVAESAALKIIARIERWAASDLPGCGHVLARWLASGDVALLTRPATPVFSLGDPNLLNWLWDGATRRLRRVDLEYAGWCDLANDLADLIEGPWARGQSDEEWLAFARGFEQLDWKRFVAARRLWAHFWAGLFAERGDERLHQQIARAATLLEEA